MDWPQKWMQGGTQAFQKLDADAQRKHCMDLLPGTSMQVFGFKDTSERHEKDSGHKQAIIRVRKSLGPQFHQASGKRGVFLWHVKKLGVQALHFESLWNPLETAYMSRVLRSKSSTILELAFRGGSRLPDPADLALPAPMGVPDIGARRLKVANPP